MKDQNFFDERERAFLREIGGNPVWRQILDKLTKYSSIQRYRPAKPDDHQEKRWIYESGQFDERDRIVSLLKPEK